MWMGYEFEFNWTNFLNYQLNFAFFSSRNNNAEETEKAIVEGFEWSEIFDRIFETNALKEPHISLYD